MLNTPASRSALALIGLSFLLLAGCRLSGGLHVRAQGTSAAPVAPPPPPPEEDPALELVDDPRVGQPVPPGSPWDLPPEPAEPPPPPPPRSPTPAPTPAPKTCAPLPAQYACAGAPGFCPEWECRGGEWVDVRRESPRPGRPGDRGF
jgi:hypothetical protein